MRRKNSPGCYCCGLDPDEQCPDKCCAEDEVWPEITILGGEWERIFSAISQDCCCQTEVFRYLGGVGQECCEQAGQYRYVIEAERKDYVFEKTQAVKDFQTRCAPPVCPDNDYCCQTGTPVHVATWKDTLEDTNTYFFNARFFTDTVEVRYGKEFITCPGDEEPICRYFLKYTLFGRYEAFLWRSQRLTSKRELTYLHPCWTYTPQFPNYCGPFASSTDCEFDRVLIDDCPHPEEVCVHPPDPCCSFEGLCTQASDTFCVQRIRYFDEIPETGQITFTDDDVNASPEENPDDFCSEPDCNTQCIKVGYITEIVLQSGTPLPPYWYSSPPNVVSVSTTYDVEWDFCNQGGINLVTAASSPVSCCDPASFQIIQCPPVQCENNETQVTITCQGLDFNEETWLDVSGQCRLRSTVSATIDLRNTCNPGGWIPGNPVGFPIAPASVFENDIGCYFPVAGVWDRMHPACGPWLGGCISYVAAGEGSCNADCFETQFCECFCQCISKFVPAFFASNTIEFTPFGEWTPVECVFNNFNFAFFLDFE